MPSPVAASEARTYEFHYAESDHTKEEESSNGMKTEKYVMVMPQVDTTPSSVAYDIYEGLPHPRHGYPCCFVVPLSMNMGDRSADQGSMAASLPLWEVQIQGPPERFAQTFFLHRNYVLPQNRNIICTPFDLHYLLLRALLEPVIGEEVTRGVGSFRSAENLLCLPSSPSAPMSSQELKESASEAKEEGFIFPVDEVDDFENGEDFFQKIRQQQSDEAASKSGIPLGEKRKREEANGPGGPSSWWRDWVTATVAEGHPTSLRRAFQPMESLLTDFCEVTSSGGEERFYRPSFFKITEWLVGRVERVKRSQALKSLIGTPSTTKESSDSMKTYYEGLVENAAVSCVAEYIYPPILKALLDAIETYEELDESTKKRWVEILGAALEEGSKRNTSASPLGNAVPIPVHGSAHEGEEKGSSPSKAAARVSRPKKMVPPLPKGTVTLDAFFGRKSK